MKVVVVFSPRMRLQVGETDQLIPGQCSFDYLFAPGLVVPGVPVEVSDLCVHCKGTICLTAFVNISFDHASRRYWFFMKGDTSSLAELMFSGSMAFSSIV